MITLWLLQLVVGLIIGVDQLVPDLDIGDGIGDVTGQFVGAMFLLDGYVPLTDIWIAVAVLFAARIGMAAWHGVVWVYHQFWGSS